MPRSTVDRLIDDASASGKILAVRIPMIDEDEEPWLAAPSRRRPPPAIRGPLPSTIAIVNADQIYIPRHELPPPLIARLVRLAAFQNPEFYAAQAMRRSTHDKPRIISCAELTSHHIALPRGCFDAACALLASLDVRSVERVDDRRVGGLRPDQKDAVEALLPHDAGVLASGHDGISGKTVVAIQMIAERGRNALILVHRRQLMDQWVERLIAFSNLPRESIGMIGGGQRKPSGIVDVALMQSLVRKEKWTISSAVQWHLVVDECHHVSAVSLEMVARRCQGSFRFGPVGDGNSAKTATTQSSGDAMRSNPPSGRRAVRGSQASIRSPCSNKGNELRYRGKAQGRPSRHPGCFQGADG